MNNTNLAKQGYKAVQKEITSDKAVELKIFMSTTARLRAIDFNDPSKFPKLAEAIVDNLKLWKILFLDLINPQNPLPFDLKASLIQLSEFTRSHSRKVLLGEATPEILVDINSSIIAGLHQSMTHRPTVAPTPIPSFSEQLEAEVA